MKIVIACDHGAFAHKEEIKRRLSARAEMIDAGTHVDERCNYPDFAIGLVQEMRENPDSLGVLMCGSGIGVSMTANRFSGIRAALVRTCEEASLAKEHNDANVLVMGGRLASIDEMMEMIETWLNAKFEGGRHIERIEIFNELGEK